MALLFLIPLFTVLFSGYLFKKYADEMAYLAGIFFVIVSLILCLILAPWQIQLLLVVLIIGFTQKLLWQNESKLKQQDNEGKVKHSNNDNLILSQPAFGDGGVSDEVADITRESTELEPQKYRAMPESTFIDKKRADSKYQAVPIIDRRGGEKNFTHPSGDRIVEGKFFS